MFMEGLNYYLQQYLLMNVKIEFKYTKSSSAGQPLCCSQLVHSVLSRELLLHHHKDRKSFSMCWGGTRALWVNGMGQGIDLPAVIQQNDAPQDDTAEWGSCTPRDPRGIFLVPEHSIELSKIDFNVLMRLKWTCIRASSKFCINKMFTTQKFNLQMLQNFPYS